MARNLAGAGSAAKGFVERLMGIFGPISSVLFALAIYAIFWKGTFIQYVPDLNTVDSAMREMLFVSCIALVYLVIQMIALASRHTGRVWAELADLVFSILPLVVLAIAIYERWPITGLPTYEFSVAVLFGTAAFADVVIVTVTSFKLLLMANDMYISN